jgi:hypothetical protein
MQQFQVLIRHLNDALVLFQLFDIVINHLLLRFTFEQTPLIELKDQFFQQYNGLIVHKSLSFAVNDVLALLPPIFEILEDLDPFAFCKQVHQ